MSPKRSDPLVVPKGSSGLLRALLDAGRAVTRRLDQELVVLGMTAAQYALLCELDEATRRDHRLRALAQTVFLEQSSLSRSIASMARRGWIATARGADRRVKHLEVTAAGRDARDKAAAVWSDLEQSLFGGPAAEVRRILERELTRLALRAAEAPSPPS